MSSGPVPSIKAQYRLRATGNAAQRLAETIALEQTVELPATVVDELTLQEQIIAQVEDVREDPQDHAFSLVSIAYPVHAGVRHISGLLNTLYGNVSMLPGIRLIDFELPQSLLQRFNGPQYGIAGLRALTGVHERPLLATAIKPRGLSNASLAALARDFILGGGDIVKDDQNLIESDFGRFKARVSACVDAVTRANDQTGRRGLYFPHLAGPADQLDERAAWLQQIGVPGVLMCPFIAGLDTACAITSRYGLVYMAHPALSGVYMQGREHGIAHELLLGTLLRLGGADISIFPDASGRFGDTRAQCNAAARRLVEPLGDLKISCPAPAGGLKFDDLDTLGEIYGADALFLIGGGLRSHGPDIRRATAQFLDRIKSSFSERLETPQYHLSACEMPVSGSLLELLHRLPFETGFNWAGRESEAYKDSTSLPFKGIRRVELIGKAGERTHFELRYFEVEPGGFTSLEKHNHTHVIIGARGEGVMVSGKDRFAVKQMDIAYVEPLEVHQLRNESAAPFGFFCIVDRERDRPRSP